MPWTSINLNSLTPISDHSLPFHFLYSLTPKNPDLLLHPVLKFLHIVHHIFLANILPQSTLIFIQSLLFYCYFGIFSHGCLLEFLILSLYSLNMSTSTLYFYMKLQPQLNSEIIFLLFSKAVLKHNRRTI